jgi:hypothetical protein
MKIKTSVKVGSMQAAMNNPLYTDSGRAGNNPLH